MKLILQVSKKKDEIINDETCEYLNKFLMENKRLKK
jgi:hypothetical protein